MPLSLSLPCGLWFVVCKYAIEFKNGVKLYYACTYLVNTSVRIYTNVFILLTFTKVASKKIICLPLTKCHLKILK